MFYNGYFSNDGNSGYDKYNATGDNTPDGILDWNQEQNMSEYSYNFSTLIHEIGHSLGLDHPFDGLTVIPNASQSPASTSDASWFTTPQLWPHRRNALRRARAEFR